jgi:EAL domain-containing protein (putative c-di-GMP-specific phosphodiesterase class I)/GGDEF domain-containing protein
MVLPLLPLGTLPGYLLWGEVGLVVTALGLAALIGVGTRVLRPTARSGGFGGLRTRDDFIAFLDDCYLADRALQGGFACAVIQFDNAETLLDRHGRAIQSEVLQATGERLLSVCRFEDRVMPLEGGGFAIALAAQRRLDLEAMVAMSSRFQAAAAEPVALGAKRLFVTASVGFCLGQRSAGRSGAALLDAAQIAADEALRNGPGAIRAFEAGMARRRADRDAHRAELEEALDQGQVQAWFQPQISADTGQVTGFETLARWCHPVRGIIAPGEFLGTINDAGLSERLSEVMLQHALVALSRWDRAGVTVPTVGVNFSNDELRNPRLPDRLRWELDRFDLAPNRLCIEILENVISTADNDIIVRNVTELARMGCRIDLDDFGTGHTSINNIRRFKVHRLKIDRSFVSGLDHDTDQKSVVAAILSLAERMGLDTLAEGVETPAEQTTLKQLGCGDLQGFGIGRPMPFSDTLAWLGRHQTALHEGPRSGPRFG